MKLNLGASGVLAVAVVAVGALLYFKGRGAVAAAVDAVNPASSTNLVNRGVSSIGAAISGDDDWTLGGQLFEWFSPKAREVRDMLAPTPTVDSYIVAANDERGLPPGPGVSGSW